MEKKQFTIKVTYFKPSGKLYTSAEYTKEYTSVPGGGCLMYEVMDDVAEMQKTQTLPGLQSGTWGGPILVDCEEGHQCLIRGTPETKLQPELPEPAVRVLRVIEYVGPRSLVEKTVSASVHGEKRVGALIIRAATVGAYPEVLAEAEPSEQLVTAATRTA